MTKKIIPGDLVEWNQLTGVLALTLEQRSELVLIIARHDLHLDGHPALEEVIFLDSKHMVERRTILRSTRSDEYWWTVVARNQIL